MSFSSSPKQFRKRFVSHGLPILTGAVVLTALLWWGALHRPQKKWREVLPPAEEAQINDPSVYSRSIAPRTRLYVEQVVHPKFGLEVNSFWSVAALHNKTDRRISFGIWNAVDSTWELVTVKPGSVRWFEMKNTPIFVTVKGDLFIHEARNTVTNSTDILECFQLDSEPFDHKPTGAELTAVEPNILQPMHGGVNLKFFENNESLQFTIVGRNASPVVVFLPAYKPTLEPSRFAPDTTIYFTKDDDERFNLTRPIPSDDED